MFSKIFLTVLLLSVFNEICHAERLPSCAAFSDRFKTVSEIQNKLSVTLVNATLDKSFISIIDSSRSYSTFLVLSSCEKLSVALEVVNKTQLREYAKEFKKLIKQNITIDFSKDECIPTLDIKAKLRTALLPEEKEPTLYAYTSAGVTTTSKYLKRLMTGSYILLNDCSTNFGQVHNVSTLSNVIVTMTSEVQKFLPIKLTKTDGGMCKTYDQIAQEIYDYLKGNHDSRVASKEKPPLMAGIIKIGSQLMYSNNTFIQVDECGGTLKNSLSEPFQLEEIMDKIVKAVVS